MFRTEKLTQVMNDDGRLSRTYGAVLARSIRKRLDDLRDAETLEVMKTLPGRCEELTGNRKGELSLRVSANDRLIFKPNQDTNPIKPDGGLDWKQVTAIEVIEVIDYH